MNDDSLLKQPSAWLPFVMSLAALALLLGYVGMFGISITKMKGHRLISFN